MWMWKRVRGARGFTTFSTAPPYVKNHPLVFFNQNKKAQQQTSFIVLTNQKQFNRQTKAINSKPIIMTIRTNKIITATSTTKQQRVKHNNTTAQSLLQHCNSKQQLQLQLQSV